MALVGEMQAVEVGLVNNIIIDKDELSYAKASQQHCDSTTRTAAADDSYAQATQIAV